MDITDERPKDYSSMFREDNNTTVTGTNTSAHHSQPQIKPPIPSSRSRSHLNNATSNGQYHHNSSTNNSSNNNTISNHKFDGLAVPLKHREQTTTIDLRQVVAKLENLPKENHFYAMETLNKHYSSVFTQRRKSATNTYHGGHFRQQPSGYKVYIKYFDEKDTFVVRVEHNTLRAVIDKLPKRGMYRYFFKRLDETCEEVEFDESSVPLYEKDGQKMIHCQVFPC